jgi:hypothetical protein
MWKHKWDNDSDIKCYKKTGFTLSLIICIALLATVTNYIAVSQVEASPIPSWLLYVTLSLCVFLPFYPCIMSIIFVALHEKRIIKLIMTETKVLISEQQELHKRKELLDKIDEYFTKPQWRVGDFA